MSNITPVHTLRLHCRYKPAVSGGGVGVKNAEIFPLHLHVCASHEAQQPLPSVFVFGVEKATPQRTMPLDNDELFRFVFEVPWTGKQRRSEVFAPLAQMGAYSFDDAEVQRQFAPGMISQSVQILFNAYATTYTDINQQCRSRVGSCGLTLRALENIVGRDDIVFGMTMLQNTKNTTTDSDPSNCRRTDQQLTKGIVFIEAAQVIEPGTDRALTREQAIGVLRSRLLEKNEALDVTTEIDQDKMARNMKAIIDREMSVFFGAHGMLRTPSIDPLRPFHTPELRTWSTFGPSLMILCLLSRVMSKRRFFLGVVRTIRERRDLSSARAIDWANEFFRSGQLTANAYAFISFCGSMLTLIGISLVYLDDVENENVATQPWDPKKVIGTEDNKVASIEGGDDCDGVARENYALAMDIVNNSFHLFGDDDSKYHLSAAEAEDVALFKLVRRLLRMYVPVLMLGDVTTDKLVYGGPMEVDKDKAIAHTFCALIPFSLLLKMVGVEQSAEIKTTRAYRDRQADVERFGSFEDDLPVMVAEGTASADPLMMPIEVFYKKHAGGQSMAEAQRLRALNVVATRSELVAKVHELIDSSRLQTEMFITAHLSDMIANNRESVSTFYQWAAGFSCTMFADIRKFNWAFSYTGVDGRSTYGVPFNDFVIETNRLIGAPRPNKRSSGIVSTLTISKLEAAQIDMIIGSEEPSPSFDNDHQPDLSVPIAAGVKEMIDNLALKWDNGGRLTGSTRGTPMHRPVIPVSGRIKDIGVAEAQALQAVAKMHAWSSIRVRWTRVAKLDVPFTDPIDVLDVDFYF
jgi:hypothetical protein